MDTCTLALTLLSASVLAVFYAINGLKFAKLTIGPVSIDCTPAGKLKWYLVNHFLRLPGPTTEAQVRGAPQETLDLSIGRVEVAGFSDLPPLLLTQLQKWCADKNVPLEGFEFAVRSTAQLECPWVVKFAGRKKLLKATYTAAPSATPLNYDKYQLDEF